MEDVELFLAPLTARSKIREVIRGLVATRQVHTISLGHAPHFYVAGTLPEFEPVSTIYSSSSMPASAYFLRSFERDEESPSPAISLPFAQQKPACSAGATVRPVAARSRLSPCPRTSVPRRSRSNGTPVRRLATNGTSTARPQLERAIPMVTTGNLPVRAGLRSLLQWTAGTQSFRCSSPALPGCRMEPARLPGPRWSASKSGKPNGTHASSHTGNGTRPTGLLRAFQAATVHAVVANRPVLRGASAPAPQEREGGWQNHLGPQRRSPGSTEKPPRAGLSRSIGNGRQTVL